MVCIFNKYDGLSEVIKKMKNNFIFFTFNVVETNINKMMLTILSLQITWDDKDE